MAAYFMAGFGDFPNQFGMLRSDASKHKKSSPRAGFLEQPQDFRCIFTNPADARIDTRVVGAAVIDMVPFFNIDSERIRRSFRRL
jgi:hypothetical protein